MLAMLTSLHFPCQFQNPIQPERAQFPTPLAVGHQVEHPVPLGNTDWAHNPLRLLAPGIDITHQHPAPAL